LNHCLSLSPSRWFLIHRRFRKRLILRRILGLENSRGICMPTSFHRCKQAWVMTWLGMGWRRVFSIYSWFWIAVSISWLADPFHKNELRCVWSLPSVLPCGGDVLVPFWNPKRFTSIVHSRNRKCSIPWPCHLTPSFDRGGHPLCFTPRLLRRFRCLRPPPSFEVRRFVVAEEGTGFYAS